MLKKLEMNITANPKVYIVIINYNGWPDTIECMESVLRNDYPNYQVVVIDNNSPDKSLEYIRAWAEGKLDVWVKPDNQLRHLSFPPIVKPIPYVCYIKEEAEKGGNLKLEEKFKICFYEGVTTKYPLIFIQSGDNLGFAGGNNVGIKYALAKEDVEYFWLLNNDTVIEKNSLSRLMEAFQLDENIGISGSKLLRYDKPSILQSLCGTKKLTWRTGSHGEYLYSNCNDDMSFNNIFEIRGYIIGASMLIKKDLLKDIGLFDEAYFMWAEESDFCMRALKRNWKMYCCPKSRVYHKEGASSGIRNTKFLFFRSSSRTTFSRFIITGYLDVRNNIYFIKKHFGLIGLIGFFFTGFIKKEIRRTLGIILYDDNKLMRIFMLLKGIKDGIFNNLGKPRELL